jgi:hypothetical protein
MSPKFVLAPFLDLGGLAPKGGEVGARMGKWLIYRLRWMS